jgi:hypothetical protein
MGTDSERAKALKVPNSGGIAGSLRKMGGRNRAI